jgi:uncharacterized protein DUF4440
MRHVWLTAVIALILFVSPAVGQAPSGDKKRPELEKTLEDVTRQWLCAYQYYKPKAQDCLNFRASYWSSQFFEIYPGGQVQTKAEMVTSQTKSATAHPDTARGEGPNSEEFKLMAVYGDVALATDRTVIKAPDANGQLSVTGEARVLRVFVKENGKWRPAAAALVGLEKPK